MDGLGGNLVFLGLMCGVSLVCTTAWRYRALRTYETTYGTMAADQPGLRKFSDLFKQGLVDPLTFRRVPYRYHAFISFERLPSIAAATQLANGLRSNGLSVKIINRPLIEDPAAESLQRKYGSNDVGVEPSLRNALLQSATVIVLASRSTFSNYWVLLEFTMAMRVSSLVLLVSVDDAPPEQLLPFGSLAFRWLLSAPVYSISNRNQAETIERLTAVISSLPVDHGRLFGDVAAATLTAGCVLAALVLGQLTGIRFQISRFPGAFLFFAIAFVISAVIPCRMRLPRHILLQHGFRRLVRGWNIDIYRFYGMFLAPLFSMATLIDNLVIRIFVMFFFLSGPWLFELLNEVPQRLAIIHFRRRQSN